jgi:predicted Zn-dependent protease
MTWEHHKQGKKTFNNIQVAQLTLAFYIHDLGTSHLCDRFEYGIKKKSQTGSEG